MKKIIVLLLSLVMLLSISTNVYAVTTEDAVITVSSDIATPGSVINVDLSIKNNPGIIAMAFCVEYDATSFEYIDYTEGYLTNYTITNHSDKGIVSFVSVEDRNIKTNGTFLTLNFKIKATAENGTYYFVIKNNNPDKYGTSLHNSFANSNEEFVLVTAVNGIITVDGDYVAPSGDVNRDGKRNNKDLALLMQHINGWEVEILLTVADVNADGKINNKDYALLLQFINGWDVQLGEKTDAIDNDDDNDGIPDKVDDDDNGDGIPDDEESYGNQGPLVFF